MADPAAANCAWHFVAAQTVSVQRFAVAHSTSALQPGLL